MKEEDDFKEQISNFDIDNEIDIVQAFLKDFNRDSEQLRLLLEEMKIFRKHDVLKQIEHWHGFLKFYELFQSDVQINAERVKRISSSLKKEARDLPDNWKKILKEDDRWNFNW